MSQITKGYNPAQLIISLEIFQTRIILLHAHPQIIYYNKTVGHLDRLTDSWTFGQTDRQLDIWTD